MITKVDGLMLDLPEINIPDTYIEIDGYRFLVKSGYWDHWGCTSFVLNLRYEGNSLSNAETENKND